MINYWPIENNVNDVIDGANMIGPTPAGSATLTADRFGNVNSAIHFNNSYYTVPSGIYFYGDFTLAVWLKIYRLSAYQVLLDFGNTAQTNNVWISPIDSNQRHTLIQMYDPSQYDSTYFCSCSSYLGTTAVTLNAWFLLVLTLSGTTANLYLNGTLTNTFTGFFVPTNTIRNVNYIGVDSFGSAKLITDLDDLRIYNRTLNQTEINTLLTMTSSQTTTTSTSNSTTLLTTTTSTALTTTTIITSTTTLTTTITASTSTTTLTATSSTTSTSLIITSIITSTNLASSITLTTETTTLTPITNTLFLTTETTTSPTPILITTSTSTFASTTSLSIGTLNSTTNGKNINSIFFLFSILKLK